MKKFDGKRIYDKAIHILEKLDEFQLENKRNKYLCKLVNLAMQNADDFVALERAVSFMADRYNLIEYKNLHKFLMESKKEFDVGFLFQISIAEENHIKYVFSK